MEDFIEDDERKVLNIKFSSSSNALLIKWLMLHKKMI